MVLNEWSSCPNCKMCANYSDLKKIIENSPECPMCETTVNPMDIKIANDPQAEFKALQTLMKDPTTEENDENGGDLDSDAENEELLQ